MPRRIASIAGLASVAAWVVAVGACALPPAAGARSASGTSSVLAWGANAAGQLGEGKHTPGSDVPVNVELPAGTKVTAVAAGGHHSLAVTSSGAALAWGINVDGELGDGSTSRIDGPVKVKLPAGTKVTAVAAADSHSCSGAADGGYSLAVTWSGSVLAWGYNVYGELGDGSITSSDVPVKVKLPAGTKVTGVAAGGVQSLAVTSTGQVLAWGYNSKGQLGDGKTTQSDVPVKVKLPTGTKVTAVAAGCLHSLAVTSTGHVLAWGYNSNGQLGDGSITSSDVPVKVKLPTGTKVTAVAAGCSHSLAVTTTGHVLAWGYNSNGQLGDGKTTQSDVPVKVKLPTGTKVTAVAAGCLHSLALTSTGHVLAWGYNALGQLGDGKTTQSDVPVKVKLPAGTKATKLGAGSVGSYSLALVHHVSR